MLWGPLLSVNTLALGSTGILLSRSEHRRKAVDDGDVDGFEIRSGFVSAIQVPLRIFASLLIMFMARWLIRYTIHDGENPDSPVRAGMPHVCVLTRITHSRPAQLRISPSFALATTSSGTASRTFRLSSCVCRTVCHSEPTFSFLHPWNDPRPVSIKPIR